MKLYISMPMNGKTAKQINRDRNIAIAKAVSALGLPGSASENGCGYNGGLVEVIDQLHPSPDKVSALECLGYSISKMAEADVVFFAEGWEQARGCKIEYQCATAYGKQVITA